MNNAQSSTSNHAKSPDYVYFDRTTAGFSDDAVPRAKAAQLKLEHYYKVAVDAAIERNQRCAGSSQCAIPTEIDFGTRYTDALSWRESLLAMLRCPMNVNSDSSNSSASANLRSCG